MIRKKQPKLKRKSRIIKKPRSEELLLVAESEVLEQAVSYFIHEISQPITAILSYSQAAQRMLANEEPKLREILSYIVDDIKRSADIIRRMRLLINKSKSDVKDV